MMDRTATLFFTLVALSATACSSSPSSTDSGVDTGGVDVFVAPDVPVDTGPPSLTIAEFCASVGLSLAAPSCTYLQRCCSSAEITAIGSTYNPICSPTSGGAFIDSCRNQLTSATGAMRAMYNAALGGSCARGISAAIPAANQMCTGPEPYAQQNNPPVEFSAIPDCAGAITGTIAAGAACNTDFECANGAKCMGLQLNSDGSMVTTQGTCTVRAADDGVCNAMIPCRDGRTCRDGMCQLKSGGGQGCDLLDQTDCREGFYCNVTTCAVRKSNGESCTFPAECESLLCTSNVCSPRCMNAGGTSDASVDAPASGG